jgi:hypothetical protein
MAAVWAVGIAAEGAGHASDALLCAKAAQLNSAAVKQTMDLPANMMFPCNAMRTADAALF